MNIANVAPDSRGLTIIELLIAVTVMALVAAALGGATHGLAAAWHDGRRESEAARTAGLISERLAAWLRQTRQLTLDGGGTVIAFELEVDGATREARLSWNGAELRLAVAGQSERVLARGVTAFQARLEGAAQGRLLRIDWTLMAVTGRLRPRSAAIWIRSEMT